MRVWLLLALLLSGLAACADDAAPSLEGNACASDDDCGVLHCIADAEAEPEDLAVESLICGDLADGSEPHRACERAEDCAHGLCLLAGACARPCEAASDCDASERCQDVFARRGAETLTALQACVNRVDAPEGTSIERELRADAIEDGDTEIEIDPVDEDETTLVVLEHESSPWPDTMTCRPPFCVLGLRAGDETLFDAAACGDDESPLVPIASGDHLDPIVLRFDPAAAALGGEDGFIASIRSEAAGDLQLTRLGNRAQRMRLDLNLFYVGARDLASTGDRGPALVADALDRVDEIFAPSDIYIGDVRQIDVRGELPERGVAFQPKGDSKQGFATLSIRYGVYVELPSLFRLSAGASNVAVNVFFVGDIEARAGDGEPEAEAGGIPGPLGMHGTGGSGIVIAADMMGGDPQALGRTLAHELGHYLGLFHTSESDGCVRDALADTPSCTDDDDADENGLDVADCGERGADNLMFWAKTDGVTLTPDQIGVLRSALVLQ